jgi:hypothetical protein
LTILIKNVVKDELKIKKMKIIELKEKLTALSSVSFQLANGELIPAHFHITEVGRVSKHFIDCGGTERKEEKISFQLWTADDFDHRLAAKKMLAIVDLAEKRLNLPNAEIEVEYQSETIGKFGLEFKDGRFILQSLQTDCLAKDNCGIPSQKIKKQLTEMNSSSSACQPGSGCC